jgi:predicted metal-dependent peptidase
MIDLSGSVGQKEYADFISEIIGICKAYQERISMRIFSHDVDCYDNGVIENGNIEKVKKMQLKGGGGTSFSTPLKYLKDNNINPKCLIWLTDGYGDSVERQNFPILWVLTKNGSDDLLKDSGQVIQLKE